MHPDLTERILQHLETVDKIDTLDLVEVFGEEHQKIVGALKSIEAHGDLVRTEPTSRKRLELTEEGQAVIANGSHEAVIYNAIPDHGIVQADLMKLTPAAKVGFSKAMSQGWIMLDKSVNPPIIKRKVDKIEDLVKENLIAIANGPEYAKTLTKLETDLTIDMMANALWKDLKFKAYNFNALGAPPSCGHLHPLLKVRGEFRQIFFEMGFSEMPTNNFVESSFWNFDALFQPQQHPARDAHDTFFINHPSKSYKFPQDYLQRVKQIHSKGAHGSQGYGYDWKLEEAQKNLLRTHTTAVSARMLYKLANQAEGFKPVKYFSIDKVFRNETLDATHLAEFHQVEGVIADVGLTLGDLIGTLYEFFRKLGITQLEFKPAYNPYTEPSMEIFCFHPGLNKWIEVGNSGVFRPEMLLPMGLPENVNVIAWGLSLERPTMIKYGINNIRDLVGHKVDLKMVEEGPICRLERV
uniref:phenylalanine--tRNA ligase n=1 Tax=Glossina austeni TaxID=7395 RepID=A0A1A9VWS1_GLOAU